MGKHPTRRVARVGIALDPRVLLGEDVKKWARGWTRATVRKFLREFVAPTDPSSFPIQEAGGARGRMCEGSVVLPLEVARAVVRASGQQLGITYRPRMQGETSPIPGSMVWAQLPAEVQALLPALWKKLATSDQLSPYLGGLVSGVQVGRVGVRILGEGLVSGGVLHLVGDALGALVAPKRVVVRVGGCPVEWGLPGDGWKGVRAELPAVFGEEVAWVGADCQVLPSSPFWLCAPPLARHPGGGRGRLAGGSDVRRLQGVRPHLEDAGRVAPPPTGAAAGAVGGGAPNPPQLGYRGTVAPRRWRG